MVQQVFYFKFLFFLAAQRSCFFQRSGLPRSTSISQPRHPQTKSALLLHNLHESNAL